MGRWAQHRRAGGGASTYTNEVEAASLDSPTVAFISYIHPLSAASLNPAAFVTDNARTGIAVAQAGTNDVRITFNGNITAATFITYTGTTPGITTPQVFGIS